MAVIDGDGSSPHTRGLLRVRQDPTQHPVDHPRTRGVYCTWARVTGPTTGSSPHTRGLRLAPGGEWCGGRIIPAHAGFTLDDELTVAHARIIPAHAGFTCCAGLARHEPQDHPRTRGVYGRAIIRGLVNGGSSPHTRGLRRQGRLRRRLGGIIPAHAGFTACPWSTLGSTTDHPRTRGVYNLASVTPPA